MLIQFVVEGTPAPQGSKRHVGNGRLVESSKALRPWRATVTARAVEAMRGKPAMGGPLELTCVFTFTRPSAHFGKNGLKASAPLHKTTAPDTDKLTRAICDALADAGVYRNDAQVARIVASKIYGTAARAFISIDEIAS